MVLAEIDPNTLWQWIIGGGTAVVGAYTAWIHGRIKQLERNDSKHKDEYHQLRLDILERFVPREEYKELMGELRKVHSAISELKVSVAGKVDK